MQEVSDLVRKAWEIGRGFDLTGIGYGRIHWDNEKDVYSTPFSYYFFLAGLVRLTGAKRILEIGTHCGGSIRAMEAGLSSRDGAVLVTVDVSRESDPYLSESPLIRKVVGDANSAETFATIQPDFAEGCDLLYIDACHDFWPTYQNYALYVTALRPTLVVLDDITLNPGMEQFWELLKRSLPPGHAIDATEIVSAIRPWSTLRPGFGIIVPALDPPIASAVTAPFAAPARRLSARDRSRERIGQLGGRVRALLRTVRAAEWWAPKLSPLLAIAYLEIGVHRLAPAAAYPALGALVVGLALLAAYGHAINDLFDIASDQSAGKANGMAPLSPLKRGVVIVALAAGAMLPWLVVSPSRAALWAWAGIYALLTAYSMPPIRFKERGFSGAITDASMAHAVPTLFVCLLFTGLAPTPAAGGAAVIAAAVAWAASVGLRNILLGQKWDYENDLRSGTVTFTVGIGMARASRLVRIFFFSEFGTLGLLLLAAFATLPWLAPLVVLAVAFDLWKVRVLMRTAYDPAPEPGNYVPLHDLYQVWLPMILSIGVAVQDWRFALLPVVHAVLFHDDIRRRGAVAVVTAAWSSLLRRAAPAQAPRTPLAAAGGVAVAGGPPPPHTCYVICATQRSGSSLLCEILISAGLGRPAEYFLPWARAVRNPAQWTRGVPDNWRLPVELELRQIHELGRAPNGVFGVKMMWDHLEPTIAILRVFEAIGDRPDYQVLSALWPNLKYIHITRRDRIRQAVSLAKAQQTGEWADLDDAVLPQETRAVIQAMRTQHGTSPGFAGSPEREDDAVPPRHQPPDLRYDFAQLAAIHQDLQDHDNAWQRYFHAAAVEPLRIVYEDLVGNEDETASEIARYLGIAYAARAHEGPRAMRRQSDQTNDDWARRFTKELAASGVDGRATDAPLPQLAGF